MAYKITDREKLPVTILASGVTLGVYLPALLIRNQLQSRGFEVHVEVLENLYPPNLKDRLFKNKQAFHESFAVALMGQKLSVNVTAGFDPQIVESLFESWRNRNCRNFIVFSGFWMPLLHRYGRSTYSSDINVDKCHMDAAVSVSWAACERQIQKSGSKNLRQRDIWFFSSGKDYPMYEIPVSDLFPIPQQSRDCRLVVHGGGWGIGTYRKRMEQIPRSLFDVDLVIHDPKEANQDYHHCRYLMNRPGWDPWIRDAVGSYTFPPMGEVKGEQYREINPAGEYHLLFDYIRNAKAIISKPGGMTMVDSLAAATPLIHLEPFGDYESKNAALWEELGFSISFSHWIESGARTEPLDQLHQNLLKARRTFINFGEDYLS